MSQTPERNGSPARRLVLACIGVFFLASALFGAKILYVEGLTWWLVALTAGASIVAVDFLASASFRRGAWPLSAYFLIDVLTPW